MKHNVQVDLLGHDSHQGNIAAQLVGGGLNLDRKRPFIDDKTGRAYVTVHTGGDRTKKENWRNIPVTNATLRRDEWKQLDAAIVPIAEDRLAGVNDLISAGLVYNLGNGMGTTVLEWHDISDAMEAELTMDGVTRGQNDRVVFGHHYLPIPILHVDYEINARELEASRKLGNPLDTSNAERAARKIMEKLEEMFFTDTTYAYGGGTIYSYLNHPDRNQVTLTGGWDDSARTGSVILEDIQSMKQASLDAKRYGPWVVYLPPNFEVKFDNDYTSNYPKTIRERIMQVGGIADVKVIDHLTDDNVVMVEMKSDVVRLVQGFGLRNVQWSEEGEMLFKFKVMTIRVPQIRSDQNGSSGVVHGSV
jgi:uncharacterized linocin/CFP29 family protein